MNAITVLFAFFAGLCLLHSGRAAKIDCVGNTEYRSCQPCDSYCNMEPQICTLECRKGNFCGCKAGYVRRYNGSSECVKPEQCPPPPKVNCVGNTTRTGCRPCDSTCNQDTQICPLICQVGNFCGCKSGYVRVFEGSSQCVKRQDCPPPKVNCVGNTTRTGCRPCDSTCNQPTRFCTAQCIEGDYCRCNNDYVLLPDNSTRCVKREDCPPPKVNCVGNTEPTGCRPCDSYCNEEPQVCTLECEFGDFCRCKQGWIRLSRGSSECVKPENCPKKCQR